MRQDDEVNYACPYCGERVYVGPDGKLWANTSPKVGTPGPMPWECARRLPYARPQPGATYNIGHGAEYVADGKAVQSGRGFDGKLAGVGDA